jgi:hypothetical protein
MADLVRIGVAVDRGPLRRLDAFLQEKGHCGPCDAFCDLIGRSLEILTLRFTTNAACDRLMMVW